MKVLVMLVKSVFSMLLSQEKVVGILLKPTTFLNASRILFQWPLLSRTLFIIYYYYVFKAEVLVNLPLVFISKKDCNCVG